MQHMFKGKKLEPHHTDTLIGENSQFEGHIKSTASLRIEGQLTGDIDCGGDVTIGESGRVHSNIVGRNVYIAGVVHGNVSTKGVISILGTGKLYGNTSAHALIIAEGALFQGKSQMDDKHASAADD